MKRGGMLVADPMRCIRRRLSWVLASWLVFQLAEIAAPVVLAATGTASEETCTCPGAVHGATCPMHHTGGSPARSGRHADEDTSKDEASRCAVRNVYPPTDLALLALAGGAGVLPRLLASDTIEQRFTRVSLQPANPSSRTELPDFPPPRA